jgi:hypothetical protein
LLLFCFKQSSTQKIDESTAETLRQELEINPDNSYRYAFETSNNINVQEEGDGVSKVLGSYSYIDPDGNPVNVQYEAGDGIGFKPSGDGIHPAILKALEYILSHLPPKEDPVDFEERRN